MRIVSKSFIFLLISGMALKANAQGSFNKTFNSFKNAPSSNENDSETKPEKKTVPSHINCWKVDPFSGKKTTALLDTLPLNFQNNAFSEKNLTTAAACLGNLGSPFQSKIFADQTCKNRFLFLRAYNHWITAPEDQLFLNTTTPYTNVKYLTTSGDKVSQEEDFKFLFSVNANKYLNVGIDYEILYSRGFYDRNATRDKLANLHGNYQSPRYEAFWQLSYDYLENFENGGITDDRYITDPLKMSEGRKEYESLNIPVYLEDAKSLAKNRHLFLNHKYHLGFERTVVRQDTLPLSTKSGAKIRPEDRKTDRLVKNDTVTEFVSVSSIIHTLYIDQSQKSYRSESANRSYYDSVAYIDENYTADTCSLFQIRNRLGISLNEGFHSWAKFGLTGFLEHDLRRYTGFSPGAALRDSANAFSRLESYTKNLVWAGGELSRNQGTHLTYNALFKMCIVGKDMGNFELKGTLKTAYNIGRHPVSFSAEGYIQNLHPDHFLERYYSNHIQWDQVLSNENRTCVSGILDIPALGFNAQASIENLKNYVFFNNKALPDQYKGNIQVLSFRLKQHLGAGILNWDNDATYQLSGNKVVLPLPDVSIYSNLYLKCVLSKVLLTHLGVDCRYHTAYYAPAYMPATGQFYTQQDVKIGNYPFMNVYANFHLKHTRFFVMYSHLSRLFASPNYFSAPHYPMNPSIIKAGISWNFYD